MLEQNALPGSAVPYDKYSDPNYARNFLYKYVWFDPGKYKDQAEADAIWKKHGESADNILKMARLYRGSNLYENDARNFSGGYGNFQRMNHDDLFQNVVSSLTGGKAKMFDEAKREEGQVIDSLAEQRAGFKPVGPAAVAAPIARSAGGQLGLQSQGIINDRLKKQAVPKVGTINSTIKQGVV